MLALPLALMPLVVALNLIASAGQPTRDNQAMCDELKHELLQQTTVDMVTPAQAEEIYQRCLRDFT